MQMYKKNEQPVMVVRFFEVINCQIQYANQ